MFGNCLFNRIVIGSAKRLKGPGVDPQQVGPRGGSSYGYNSVVRDSFANHALVPSGDSKLL